jgi:carbon storage regulator CsrA
MLILSRKVGERIVIGDGVVLVVKRIMGQRVTLGIEAPKSVHIVRGELKPLKAVAPVHAGHLGADPLDRGNLNAGATLNGSTLGTGGLGTATGFSAPKPR